MLETLFVGVIGLAAFVQIALFGLVIFSTKESGHDVRDRDR